jgi:hypothetical protein
MRGLLENFSMIDGTWLEIHKDEKLVGCGAALRDNRFQLTTALGLEDDVPSGYFLLLYTALQEAFEQNVRLVRFGSGSYDIKRRLGLHLEDTNHAMVSIAGISPPPQSVWLPRTRSSCFLGSHGQFATILDYRAFLCDGLFPHPSL